MSEPSLDHSVASRSLAVAGFCFVSCSFGGVCLGSTCYPGRLITGECAEGCRTRKLRRVASGVNVYMAVAIEIIKSFHYSVNGCCDDSCDVGEVDVSSGLRHAGDEHSSSLPDSATCICSTPRKLTFKFHILIGRRIDCVDEGIRLKVTTALRPPKLVAGGSWGGSIKDRPLVYGPNAQNSSRARHTPH